jgi:hypothetical protein
MSSILMIVLLTLMQFIAGFGLLTLFRIWLTPMMLAAMSVLMGVIVFSVVPFLLQLFFIPLTSINVFAALIVTCLLLNIKFKSSIKRFSLFAKDINLKIELYEIPFLIVIAFIVFVSVWRCFYYPPTSRDLTSGPEVIAEYAVREKTMLNSLFTVNLETTNNQFKSPFITSLQIIYKYAGFPFGQIWLSNVFICFIIFLYHALIRNIHKLLAGLLIIFFLAIPEMYAYTFMVLYDYSNAVFFFLGTWFLFEHYKTHDKKQLVFAGLLMGIATYIRSETLVLTGLLSLNLVWIQYKNGFREMAKSISWLLLPAILFYFLSVYIFINYYLPVPYNIPGLLNTNLLNLLPLLERFNNIDGRLIFSDDGVTHFAYFFFIFLTFLIADIFYSKGINKTARQWLYAVFIIYAGLALLGFILPLLDIDNSTKRGLFKIFPLMLLYMGNSGLLITASEKINKWETKPLPQR